ncbi:MAG: peptidylprolyl isomerase [Bacilli bacterium]
MKKILLVILLFFITACSKTTEIEDETLEEDISEEENLEEENLEEEVKITMVEIILEDNRSIKLELYPEKAPLTVANFLKLVDNKYYDKTVFHRVIKNFMIQTGGYTVDELEIRELESTSPIKGEFRSNGFNGNDILHTPGVISMARTMDKNSATGQFFICTGTSPHLDGDYAAFGKVVDEESLAVVMEINQAPTENVGGHFTDFAYPIIRIKTIKRV